MPTDIILTPTQIRLIKTLILNAEWISSKSVVGLTSNGLDSKGVSRTTVNDNLKDLLANHLIKSVFVDDAKGPHAWIYYDATPQGVIALLQTVNLKEISKEFNQEILGRFFPMIALHWNELLKIIGEGIPFFLKLATEQIEINNYTLEGEAVGNSSPIQMLTESINIDFSDDFSIKLKNVLLPFSEGDFTNKKPMLGEKYILVEQRIKKQFTFLFYFNLINHSNEKIHRISQYFLDSLGSLSLDNVKSKNWKPLIDMNNYKKEDIISIVNQDGQLHSIIKEVTDEIYKKFQISNSLRYIHDKII